MGLDVGELLERADEMAHSCDPAVPAEKNPGVWLGGVLGQLAGLGRDKVTLVMSPRVGTFGYWLEQLIGESTGKEGKGMVPVEGEPLGPVEVYGDDRLFVYTRLQNDPDHDGIRRLEQADQPVITLTMRDKFDLGSEMFRWELATAVAGSVLGVDPFDQPDVEESKDSTLRLLQTYAKEGSLPGAEAVPAAEAGAAVAELARGAKENGYLAALAFTGRSRASEEALARVRARVRDATKLATTAGYGPRYLHSTGQLHKGGPPTGVFVQVVQEDGRDAEVPGQPYTFSTLKQAQALADFQSLKSRGYPVLRVNLGRSVAAGWKALAESVEKSVR
jgi:glucose-6-phosphate isomerase/transaldolase/glucose-6-phosphate isomerase